jgi:OOP family OmpA-OmpF porin
VLPANVKLNDLTTVAGNVLSEAQLRVQSELNQILLKGIEFATAKADISPASAAVLDQAANALKTASDVRLEIGGHTDNVGPLPANNALSQARANAVKSYLVGKGIAANRLATKGYGPTQPIGDNNTDAGKQRNRRIEFRIAGGTATPR